MFHFRAIVMMFFSVLLCEHGNGGNLGEHLENWLRKVCGGNSLAVQWLGLCTSTAEGMDLIPGRGTKILHATWYGQKKRKM